MARDQSYIRLHPDDLEGEAYPVGPTPGKVPVTARIAPPPGSVQTPFDAAAAWSSVLQRKDSGEAVTTDAAALVASAGGGGGAPLPAELKDQLEASLGTDLDGVRVHTDGASAQATAAVGAIAYATGQDIHFSAGAYDPSSTAGKQLIAHEVAHTVQQRGSAGTVQGKLEVSQPGDASEVEADAFAEAFVRGDTQPVGTVSPGSLSRAVISRTKGKIVPALQLTPQSLQSVVNAEESVTATVTNAGLAPPGTSFQWKHHDQGKGTEVTVQPAESRATVKIKSKEAGTHNVVLEVTTTEPGCDPESTIVPLAVSVPTPKLAWRGVVTGEPGTSADGTATMRMRRDKLEIEALLSDGVKLEEGFSLGVEFSGKGGFVKGSMTEYKGNKAAWAFVPERPGTIEVKCTAKIPGVAAALTDSFTYRITADLEWLKTTIAAAQAAVLEKYMGANASLNAAANQYAAAYEKHRTAVAGAQQRSKERQQLAMDLMMGIFLAAVSGGVGGALAAHMKGRMGKEAADTIGGSAMVNATKDVSKFLVKSLDKLGKGGGGSSKPGHKPQGDKGSPAAAGGAGGVGMDPSVWARNMGAAVNAEGKELMKGLKDLSLAIRDADADQTEFEVEGDPVAVIEADPFLGALGGFDGASEQDFARELWKVWVASYAFTLSPSAKKVNHDLAEGTTVDDNTDEELIAAIEAQAGSDFGLRAKLVAAREAAEDEARKRVQFR